MLDVIFYPVSAVLWLWHSIFAAVLGESSGAAWALAIVCLVITLRGVLTLTFERHELRGDTVGRLRRRLPMIGRMLMFTGLFQVLEAFRAGTAASIFSAAQVRSYQHATLMGAPLSVSLFHARGDFAAVARVMIPLLFVFAVVGHLAARFSLTDRHETTSDPSRWDRAKRALALWVFPLVTFSTGGLLPLAILLCFFTQNTWTLLQHLGSRKSAAQVVMEESREVAGGRHRHDGETGWRGRDFVRQHDARPDGQD